MPYRPQSEFTGVGAKKRLSAHTIATLIYLQNVQDVDGLRVTIQMSTHVLSRLLRKRALAWWTNVDQIERPGEPAWLVLASASTTLTSAGLLKITQRTRGEERASDGRLSPYNVSSSDIRLALDLIARGPQSTLGADVPLEYIEA